MRDATAAFAPLVEEGVLAGVHFEGPYLSAARCGAQNPEYLRDPSTDELTELIELGRGAVRMVTLAPERDGALEAIKLLTAQRVVAAIGPHRRHVRADPRRGRRRRQRRHPPVQRDAAGAPPRAGAGGRAARRARP